MRIEHILDNATRSKLNELGNRRTKSQTDEKTPRKANKERLSERDLRELMGTNRQTYRRVNGKIKRK